MMGKRRIRMAGGMRGTNQLAELYAVVAALNGLYYASSQPTDFDVLPARIVTDSMYAIGCMTFFRKKWESNGFRSAAGTSVQHVNLIKNGHKVMDALVGRVELVHVRGHTGNSGNDEADKLSKFGRYMIEGSDMAKKELEQIVKDDPTEVTLYLEEPMI
jgi:ribonuclease HI